MANEVLMPRLSDSMEEATILRWLVPQGEPVARGQELVEVETDKATVVYEAEVAGVLLAVLVQEGASALLGQPIAVIGAPGEAAPAAAGEAPSAPDAAATPAPAADAPAAAPAAPAAAPASAPAGDGRVPATPVARRLARELGVALGRLRGSGPHGRVVKRDVLAAAQDAPAAPAPAAPAAAAAGSDAGSPKGAVERVGLSRMQQTIARRMAQSRATVPDIELTVEVDMRACVALRAELKAVADPAPSFNDLVVKAAALALREHPRVNGGYADDAFELHGRVNVGVAVAAEDALVVPTIFDADARSVGEIAATARRLAGRVRDGSITPAELGGGTFTVSNLGMFGIDSFSAVVNLPQAAILAVGALRRRPLALEDGTLVAAETMHLTLACDHRILYGADGARFLTRVRELLEQPLALLL